MARRPCLTSDCPRLDVPGGDGRCELHRERYGGRHQAARSQLERMLPAPCAYCGRDVDRGSRWVAAHRVDGDPSRGWVPAHAACNERAKHGAHLPRLTHLIRGTSL